jgi:hypothetical protein
VSAIRTVALPQPVADAVRATGRAPGYGHPAHRELATGLGPCRLCLAPFRPGEEARLLFTYDPFRGLAAEPLPGPVFVHEDACARHEAPGFPDSLLGIPLSLEAYGAERRLVRRERLVADPGAAAARLLADPDVAYVHARHAEAGCYVARIERAG